MLNLKILKKNPGEIIFQFFLRSPLEQIQKEQFYEQALIFFQSHSKEYQDRIQLTHPAAALQSST